MLQNKSLLVPFLVLKALEVGKNPHELINERVVETTPTHDAKEITDQRVFFFETAPPNDEVSMDGISLQSFEKALPSMPLRGPQKA